MSGYPRPFAIDHFYNRTGHVVEPDDILGVQGHRTEDAVGFDAMLHDVRLRVIKGGPPDAVIECEICMPHALHWRR